MTKFEQELKIYEDNQAWQDKYHKENGEFYREIGQMKRAYERRQLRKWKALIFITVFLVFLALISKQ